MDGLSDAVRDKFRHKMVVVSDKINYDKDQLLGIDQSIAQLVSNKHNMNWQEFQENIENLNIAKNEAITNLNSEQRMLDILKRKAAEGSYSLETSSSLSKRSYEGSNFGESSSKKN